MRSKKNEIKRSNSAVSRQYSNYNTFKPFSGNLNEAKGSLAELDL